MSHSTVSESTGVGSRDELLKRANDLLPLIASKAEWSEQNRRLHDDVVQAMADAGIFNMRRPLRYGGYETDSRTLSDVLATLAGADGSTAWNAAVWSISNWIACLFPDHVQDEVFAEPGARVCAVLSPTAMAEPADGGLVVNGRWQFISGAHHSHWQVILAMAPAPDGSMWPVLAVVPMSQLQIVDDWYTSGLAATGSVTTAASDLFVPGDRVLPLPVVLQGHYASELNAGSPVFSAPLVPTGCAGFAGVAVGLARAARTQFLDRLPGRKITYSSYTAQADAAVTHLNVAEATLKIDEAQFNAYRVADLLDGKGATREPWTIEERVSARVWLGRSFDLAKQAVEVLATASGGSSLYRSVPIQRIQRDVHALNLHALMHANTNYELYGRVLCGLEPNSMYL
ncbi:acyl-CoA dehydrogenase family protein [Rhizohabitans arisaemae]|uniref:acyl-CoA dehydrogenase family protein n=1 Tax=Rhizohabitans arisaemae TaxID=2720610 RepID=UPI0024B10762|nr:acyl-CoA dehydrogenase family protein [Rhizohabitans arisaemae]